MSPSQHQRLNETLRAYWESLRGSKPYPEERSVEPDALKDIWDSCFLVKNIAPQTGREGFRYDYLGRALLEAFGGDVTHQEVSAKLVDPASPPLFSGFSAVVAGGKPLETEAEFTNSQGMLIKYRSCLLPLGDTKGVQFILGGMKWKSF